jgi:hypothetical protein
MAKKKIYKSVLKVEILSEEPLDDCLSLSDIDCQITNGDWSGTEEWDTHNIELVGKEAADAIIHQGSDPDFFQMDEDGNDIDE